MKKLPIFAAALGGIAASLMVASAPVLADGKKTFRKNRCAQCHTVTGRHTVGPSLKGVIGRKAGTAEGFNKKRYSDSLIAAGEKGLVWNEKTIDAYITDPNKFLQDYLGDPKAKSRMFYPGLKKPEQREEIVEYLKEAS